jgi:TP901-1 family phage major tail protein
MPANVGRTIIVRWGDFTAPATTPPVVAGIREKSITVAGEAVDITNDDSDGWRQLLDAAQVNSVEISCSGVVVNDALRRAWFNGADDSGERLAPAEFEYSDGGKIGGDFYLQEYSETGSHDNEITFEATFVSSGPVTYQPAP